MKEAKAWFITMRLFVFALGMIIYAVSETTAFNTAPGRLGCYEDNTERVWKQCHNSHEKNTVHFCKNMCLDYKYAGMEAEYWCMCGDDIPPKALPDSRCDRTCSGDTTQTCGGGWALEIFTVDPKPVMLGKPKGCFQEATDRVWKTGLIKLQACTPQRCFNSCRGFKYAGLIGGTYCICGDTLPPTPLPKTSCQMECSGYLGKKCGGVGALAVFELSEMSNNATGCGPDDYTPNGNLGIYKLYTEPESWTAAWQHCVDDDAHLLILNSEAEAKFVRSLFAQVPTATRMHAGFHDHERKGVYRTLFGKALSATGYTAWSKQYPKKPSPLPHCGAVDKQAKLAQIDGNCVEQAPFVCEKNSRSPDAVGKAVQFDVKGALAAQKS